MPGPTNSSSPELCLLSLDGGGVRGLSTLYVLQGIMRRVNEERKKAQLSPVKPCELFDLIGGTSTGGLIAIMLGRLEMDVEDCIEAYKALSKEIFQKSSWLPVKGNLKIKGRFDSATLERCIKNIIAQQIDPGKDPDKELLNDGNKRRCRVFVTATSKDIDTETVRFQSFDSTREGIPVAATICQAARATSAATTFFEPATVGDSDQQYVDGGLGANNPIYELWEEAKDIWSPESGHVADLVKCCVSIGTGHPRTTPVADGAWRLMSETLANIATETEKTAERFRRQYSEMFEAHRCFRFNVDQGLQEVGLEEYKKFPQVMSATSRYLKAEVVRGDLKHCAERLKEKDYEASYSLTQPFPISVISRKGSQLDWFFCGMNGKVYTSWWSDGQTSPEEWTLLKGEFAAGSKVTAVSRTENQIDLFVYHSGSVYTSWWNEHTTWSSLGGWLPVVNKFGWVGDIARALHPTMCPLGWEIIGGTCPGTSDIAAVSRMPTHLDLFICGRDGNIYTSHWNKFSKTWLNWAITRSNNTPFPAGAKVSAVCRKETDLDIFACAANGEVYTTHYDEDSRMWSDWCMIGGNHQTPQFPPGANVSAVHRTPTELDVFICGQDGRIYTSHWHEGLGTWFDWSIIGDTQQSPRFPVGAKISAVSTSSKLHLFACTARGQVYHSRKESQWTKWEPVGERNFLGATEVVAVHRRDSHLDLSVCDRDGLIWRRDFYYGNDWEAIRRRYPGAPQ
ncbi:hypothetical protein ASPCAL07771 [Aspergillus calidoustus]|uniref:PNPLA domain-containing protein n=1 Tax=Aspergillus calidoustus TaxID=454130 RepID=A0A0U5GV90_ASPCI|nr:hypothetical protein ASPCAL07771 [Aspergillus calidoustus]